MRGGVAWRGSGASPLDLLRIIVATPTIPRARSAHVGCGGAVPHRLSRIQGCYGQSHTGTKWTLIVPHWGEERRVVATSREVGVWFTLTDVRTVAGLPMAAELLILPQR